MEGEKQREGWGQVVRQSSEEAQMGWRGTLLSSHSETIPTDQTQSVFFNMTWQKHFENCKVGQQSLLILDVSTQLYFPGKILWSGPMRIKLKQNKPLRHYQLMILLKTTINCLRVKRESKELRRGILVFCKIPLIIDFTALTQILWVDVVSCKVPWCISPSL